jgi:acyl-coenzyme A synthetase/AMP-(fatty) acid ligase
MRIGREAHPVQDSWNRERIISSVQPIFSTLESFGDRPCLVAGNQRWSFQQAALAADAIFADRDAPQAGLAFIHAHDTAESILAYIGAVRRGYAVHLLDPCKDTANTRLITRYRPDILIDTSRSQPLQILGNGDGVSADIAILLSTSGSTGTPKLVKLSHGNIAANTGSIISYLGLGPSDVGITSLRLFYSYGMSVVNTHLAAGAALVVTDRGVDSPEFWTLARRAGVTNVAGVPFSFELLHRMGFDPADVPSLRLLTQAGGRLDPDIVRAFAELGAPHGVEFCVMYGQTEAAPRMSWLPPDLAAEAPESIGRAIPGGKLAIVDEAGQAITRPGVSGELVYEGPNVMVGYAECREDLSFTEHIPRLFTGDIAHFDARGLFYIDGRISRFVKPFGLRVSLDEIENALRPDFPDVAVTGDDTRIVVSTGAAPGHAPGVAERLAALLQLPASVFVIVEDRPAPRLASGKIDYRSLLVHHGPRTDTPSLPRFFVREFLGLLTGRVHPPASVLEAFGAVLGPRADDHTVTFRSAGGDSLSYMQLLLLLEECLGEVPEGWDEMTVLELEHLREAAVA